MVQCVRCYIMGKVQGVWYRGTTQQMAQQLNLTGYAKNLADGRVEVLACGEKQALETLQQWCWQGPRMAEVTEVTCEVVELDNMPSSFTTA